MPASERLQGIDVARGVALLGMMSVHIFPSTVDGFDASTAFIIAAGRSAALFAVLAGVGLALLSGGSQPVAGQRRTAVRAATVGRAAVLVYVGLSLGALRPYVVVILVQYALLFLLAALFLGWRARWLALLAGVVAVVAPPLVFYARHYLDPVSELSPSYESLRHPVELLLNLTITGVYPVAAWMAYVLTGLAIGRLDLKQPRVGWGLLVGGLALAAASWLASAWLLAAGGFDAIAGTDARAARDELRLDLTTGYLNDIPTDEIWWLAVVAPHSTTPFDMLHTMGTSVCIIGVGVLVAARPRRWLVPLAATGAMTLTLYTGHVVAVDVWGSGATPDVRYAQHVVVAVLAATLWRWRLGTGPLERLSRAVGRTVAIQVTGRRQVER